MSLALKRTAPPSLNDGRTGLYFPLACVVTKPGHALAKEDVLVHLRRKFPSWWIPDDVLFVDEVPKTSVGKFNKRVLRERFAHYLVERSGA